MNSYPLYPGRPVISLDGVWQFRFQENAFLEDVDDRSFAADDWMTVPGAFDTSPEYRCRRGTGLYRREFQLTEDSPRGILKVAGVGLRARFRIDGREVGFTNLPYSGVEFETGPLCAGKHTITAAIDNNFDAEKMKLFLPYYDFYAFGGFYRSIELHQVPECAIDRVQVCTLCHETGRVALRFLFTGGGPGRRRVFFRFDTERDFHTAEVGHMESLECMVPGFRVWSPESPEMHTVEVRLGEDCIVEQFGIRTVRVGKRRILLNGNPVWLKGFNRHESHPEFGPATPEAVMLEDMQNLRSLSCNMVRGCHYPQDQRFLDLCDAFGMLVWEESLGWNNTREQMADREFCDLQEKQTRLMVRNSINHPSVIIWAFLNEQDSSDQSAFALTKRLVDAIKEEDSSRIVTFACSHTDNDICHSLLDMVSYNTYPGWIGSHPDGVEPPDEILPRQQQILRYFRERIPEEMPVLVSEMGCCAIYGQRDPAAAQWSEEFQSEYLESVIRAVSGVPEEICGLIIWQFNDAMSFHRTGGDIRSKPLGLNLAGVFDSFRRRKLAAYTVKKLFRELQKTSG